MAPFPRRSKIFLSAFILVFTASFLILSSNRHRILKSDIITSAANKISSKFSNTDKKESGPKHLVEDDFKQKSYGYNDHQLLNKYESVESWRSPDSFASTYSSNPDSRPKLPHWSKYATKGEYLKQPLIADYADGAEKIFLMIKTGGDVLWDRLPIHLSTTLTRVPYFALYSDKAGSVGGYEVIDILANVTEETLKSGSFYKYRKMRLLHDQRNVIDAADVKIFGGWELDRFKNVPMLAHAYSLSPNSDWFVFMDADTYIMMDVLTKWLKTLDPDQVLYMGHYDNHGAVSFAFGGSGVVLSRKAMQETVGKGPEVILEFEKLAEQWCCGDEVVGQMVHAKTGHGLSAEPEVHYRFQRGSFYNFDAKEETWCKTVHSFHHLNSHEIEILYEYERLKGPKRDTLTYFDLYRDFYLPYIDHKMEHWDNFAQDNEWTESTAKTLDKIKDGLVPYESFDSCKEACELTNWCVSFRHVDDKKYCGLSGKIQLGKPTLMDFPNDERDKNKNTEHDKLEYHDVTSGFMIERIREFRKKQPCDILYGSSAENKPDGDENDQYEGWFARGAKKETQKKQEGW